MADNDHNNADGAPENPDEDKTQYAMLTDELKDEINECFDIFDKDKDG